MLIRSSHFLILVALFFVLLAAGLYYFLVVLAPEKEVVLTEEVPAAPVGVVDGEYYVTISSVTESPEETNLAMEHVTYFEGEAARTSAEAEVVCGAEIETCVPTLEDGYYVRPSGAPGFDVALIKEVTFSFLEESGNSIEVLKELLEDTDPVFIVTLQSGEIVRVVQKTP